MPSPYPKQSSSNKALGDRSGNSPVASARTIAATRAARTAVLHITPDLEICADAREVVDLSIQTHRAGWRPIVASAGGALVLEAERAAVRHTRAPLNRRNIFARWRNKVQLEALVQRERPAIIHAHGFDVLPIAHWLNAIHKTPLLVDLTTPIGSVTNSMKKLVQSAAARQARFRVPSEYMARHLRHDFGLTSDMLYHVPPGVDMQWFEAVRVTPERLHNLSKLWRIPEQATVIVMATPMAPGYGHKALLEALSQLHNCDRSGAMATKSGEQPAYDKNTDVYVVLVGDDRPAPGTRAEIERLVTACGLEGKAIMPETCSDWPAACWLASIIVASNDVPRGQAMELLAAQAIGRPVIVTDCGANREMVQGGETAWVVPQNDKHALTQALMEAINMNAAQRIDLAVRTRDFVSDKFQQHVWLDAIFQLYGAMLAPATISTAVRAA